MSDLGTRAAMKEEKPPTDLPRTDQQHRGKAIDDISTIDQDECKRPRQKKTKERRKKVERERELRSKDRSFAVRAEAVDDPVAFVSELATVVVDETAQVVMKYESRDRKAKTHFQGSWPVVAPQSTPELPAKALLKVPLAIVPPIVSASHDEPMLEEEEERKARRTDHEEREIAARGIN